MINSSFGFLAIELKRVRQPTPSCGLAWIEDCFHLNGNNYFIYTCHNCHQKQIQKGKKPNLNWGGIYV